jgi:hypothetical protein
MDLPPPVDATGTQYERFPARAGTGGWVLALLHLALGGVTVALALEAEVVEDKAAFSNEAWRVAFGAVGVVLVLLALRAMVRSLRAETTTLTPETFRRAALRGRILLGVGVAFVAIGLGFAKGAIEVYDWAKPFYVAGGIYTVILGLVFQWNPTRYIRQQRVRKGQGRPGRARILRASDTGMSVNDAPEVRVHFELEVGGRTYEASDSMVMERAKLALLIPGATVNVTVDEVDPNVFHIDWDSWKGPGGT